MVSSVRLCGWSKSQPILTPLMYFDDMPKAKLLAKIFCANNYGLAFCSSGARYNMMGFDWWEWEKIQLPRC
jgi:hypothetical protein